MSSSGATPSGVSAPSGGQALSSQQQPTTPGQPAGLIDLEKELTCSICTDILFQPLTLLNCLHTFCGSCLKEWFSWQAVAAKRRQRDEGRSAPSRNPYTCPSCRAGVKDTRPNATVTTLLDMYMQANPGRGKSEEDKRAIAKSYKSGDNVLPKATTASPPRHHRRRRAQETEGEEEDRRLLEEVRDMSLRDLEGLSPGRPQAEQSGERDARHGRRRDRSAGHLSPESDQETASRAQTSREIRGQSAGEAQTRAQSTRSLEHQSSLRSLLSASDLISQELEEEILRQIVDEGLLDGIDLRHVTPAQEEEITERIAAAYRQRQRAREREPEIERRRGLGGAEREDASNERSSRPPASRSYLLDAALHNGSERRSSSQGSGRLGRNFNALRHSREDATRAAGRSSTDLSNRPETREAREDRNRRNLSQERRSTDPERTTMDPSTRNPAQGAENVVNSTQQVNLEEDTAQATSTAAVSQQRNPLTAQESGSRNIVSSHTPQTRVETIPAQRDVANVTTIAPFMYCSNCAKPRIQYDLHYNCHVCHPTTGNNVYSLCLRCYRLGKGSLHTKHQIRNLLGLESNSTVVKTGNDHIHEVVPERYLAAPDGSSAEAHSYHQAGVFCEVCYTNANDCYWRCEWCNDGEWGFCNTCVKQARHCTHPLLALGSLPSDESSAKSPQNSQHSQLALTPLPIHTTCNICSNPIPPSNTRFHCPTCNEGDYDICSQCYRALVSSGKIDAANGPQGWRRCENGHRMLVVGFESKPDGQRRVVVENVVGGWQMRDEDVDQPRSVPVSQEEETSRWTWHDTSSGSVRHKRHPMSQSSVTADSPSSIPGPKLPPSGGFGSKMTALWTRVPEEGVDDELTFPKLAEVTEVLDINEDWCWGVYCKEGGLFPGAYGRVIRFR